MNKWIVAACLLLSSALGFGQASRYDSVATSTTFINGVKTVQILSGAEISVCVYPVSSNPCTNYAPIFTDPTMSTPAPNPFVADLNGNFGFWAGSGTYQYTFSYRGQNFGPVSVTLAVGGGGGGGGTTPPAGVPNDVQFNLGGSPPTFGADSGKFIYDPVTGTLGATKLALPTAPNGTDLISGARATDTSPTGNFINFRSFAGTPLFDVDIAGIMQAGSVPTARLQTVQGNGAKVSLASGSFTPGNCRMTDSNGNTTDAGAPCGTGVGGGGGISQDYLSHCTGTATSSATLVIPPFGSSGSNACTATVVSGQDTIMEYGGTLKNLRISTVNAGINASSGVVSVIVNGSATGITCTVGTSKACTDLTHTFVVSAGDAVRIQFTTQASETLAAVQAQLLLQGAGGSGGISSLPSNILNQQSGNYSLTALDLSDGRTIAMNGSAAVLTLLSSPTVPAPNAPQYFRVLNTGSGNITFAGGMNVYEGVSPGVPATSLPPITPGQGCWFTEGGTNYYGYCTSAPGSGGGLADPGANGLMKRTALNVTAQALSADVIALWSGTCSTTTFLRGDGSCQTPAGGGNMTASGSYVVGHLLKSTNTAGTAPSDAVPGTDYVIPSGNTATATALAATPAQCSGGQFATGVAASGNANCGTPSGGGNTTSSASANNKVQKGTGVNTIGDSSIVDNGTTVTTALPFNAGGISVGTAPVVCGSATGCLGRTEGSTAMTPTANQYGSRFDSTLHYALCSFNAGAETPCDPLLTGDFGGTPLLPLVTGYHPTTFTVSTLPTASANSGSVELVTDGVTSADCTTGGGTFKALCRSNGTVWSAITGSGVTAVTGTPPVNSSGGNTPAISMAVATTSVDGYLSHVDWTTFNTKVGLGISNTFTAGTQDFGSAAHTAPAKRGLASALPGSCFVGEEYFATDATAGQNKFYCTATNTWTQQLNTVGAAFAGGSGSSFQDVVESPAPSNPASGTERCWTDSTTHQFSCVNSSGASTLPSGGSAYSGGSGSSYQDIVGSTNPANPASGTVRSSVDSATGKARFVDSNGISALGPDVMNSSVIQLRDEFVHGGTAAGNLGDLGWGFFNIAGTSTWGSNGGALPNTGILRVTTGATANNGGGIALNGMSGTAGGMLGAFLNTTGWQAKWVVRINSVDANTVMHAGFNSDVINSTPSHGCWVKFDGSVNATNFIYECRLASTSTVATGPTADTNFHTFCMRSTTAGTVLFSSDSGCFSTETPITSNVDTSATTARFDVSTLTTATKSADIDYFAFKNALTGRF